MTGKSRIALAGILVALPALPLWAATRPAPTPTTPNQAEQLLHNPKALARYLGLAVDQVATLKTLGQALHASLESLHEARAPLCDQIRAELDATPPDAASVGTTAIALYQNKEQAQEAFKTFDTAFSAILTAPQLAKYNALKDLAHVFEGHDYNVLGACPPAQP